MRRLIDAYLGGAEGVDSAERARIFRLGWDFAGTELASRNEQYERFYLASGARNMQSVMRVADPTRGDALVERFLNQ